MVLQFAYEGRFQWWSYDVTHGQLLLRRTPSPERETQVDVLFKNVVFVSIDVSSEGLEVYVGDASEAPEDLRPRVGNRRLFVLKHHSGTNYIVAGAVFHKEWDGHYGDPSPLIQRWT